MAQIPKESVEKVLEATDIVDLIGSYIQVKRAGSSFRANCPFHHEKTPSFYITPSTQRFHCFGCGKGGDAISFVRDHENLPFVDAVRKLASRAGIHIVEEDSDPNADQSRRVRGKLLDIHREAAGFFHDRLMKDPAAAHARDYMKSRGFGSAMAASWSVGWMPDNPKVFLDWARSRKFTGRELAESGLAKQKDDNNPKAGLFVRFQDRLMFPIRNEIGDVIAFSGRQLRENKNSGKYINSPETPIFKKSRVFFGLDRAKKPILKEKAALLCEGQIDAICCHELGIEHAIATCGTACTREHARLLKRYTNNVLVCYDADNAGLAAAEKAYRELVPEGLAVRIVEMPAGDDPDTFLKAQGAPAFRELLANAKEFFDFKLQRAKSAGFLNSAAGRTAVLGECTELLSLMTDSSADTQLQNVAIHLETSINALRDAIAKAKANPKKTYADKHEQGDGIVPVFEPTPLHDVISYLCFLALTSAVAQHYLGEHFESLHDASRWLEGVSLLESIVSAAPDPSSPAAVNTFLAGLPGPDRLTLMNLMAVVRKEPDEGPLQAAERSVGMLACLVLECRDASIKAALRNPGLSTERMIELLTEAKEVALLMKEMPQRTVWDQELPASTYKEKQPAWKKRTERPQN